MEKHYVQPTLERIEWKLNDVILYSPPQATEAYEVPILKNRAQELEGAPLPAEDPVGTDTP